MRSRLKNENIENKLKLNDIDLQIYWRIYRAPGKQPKNKAKQKTASVMQN